MREPKPKAFPHAENLVRISGGSAAERTLLAAVLQDAGYTVSEKNSVLPEQIVTAELDAGLSPREQEVLEHASHGLPDKAIASELGISTRTVRYHMDRAMRKLGAQNRTEAVTRSGLAGRFI